MTSIRMGDLTILELHDYGLQSKLVHKYIRDPIHIYIPFSKLEELVIDSEIFQRLRRIHQLQVAYSVYPGATHTRFLHSLGVMHLAGKFALALLRMTHSFQNQETLELLRKIKFDVPSFEDLGIDNSSTLLSLLMAARLGGLLHDIGHMPFSHAFDEAIIANSRNIQSVGIYSHEDTGYFIYRNYLRDIIERFVRENYEEIGINTDVLLEAVDAIMAPSKAEKHKRDIYVVLRHVVKEFLYPADIIDFCLRDSYFTGAIEYGKIDVDRLFMFSIILRRESPDSENLMIGLLRKALGALRAYLYSRMWLFNNVYFHKFSRLMDYAVKDLIREIYRREIIDFDSILIGVAKGEEQAIEELAKLDDSYILFKAIESGIPTLVEYARRILYRRPHLKEVFALEITIDPAEIERVKCAKDFDEITNKLRKDIAESLGISPEDIIIDSPPIKFFPLNPYLPRAAFPIVDAEKQTIVNVHEAHAWIVSGARISDLAVFRVLMKIEAIRHTGLSVDMLRRKISQIVSGIEDEIKSAFIKKYSSITWTVTM